MSNLFSYLGIAGIWVGFLSLTLLFFYYCVNRKRYEKIIRIYYDKGFLFPVPYHFHSLMGFFGSFTLVYYFTCIKRKKKPLLMFYKNREVYDFFDTVPDNLSKWMKVYYRITLFTLACIAFTFLMVLMKYISLNLTN